MSPAQTAAAAAITAAHQLSKTNEDMLVALTMALAAIMIITHEQDGPDDPRSAKLPCKRDG